MGSSVPPITPGPGGPALVVMPNTGAPVKSATDAASESARQLLASTGSAIPAEHHSTNQPRVAAGHEQGGQFAPNTAVRELPTGEQAPGTPAPPAPAPGTPAPETGQAPPAPVPGAPGTETPPAAEGAPAGEEPEGGAPDPNELVVRIAGRQPGEEVEIEVSDRETAERLRQLSNAALRGDEARGLVSQAEEMIEQAEMVRLQIDTDPAGFVIDTVLPENPEAVDHLILHTLVQPEVWRRLAPTINKMIADQNEFRIVSAEQRSVRAETASKVPQTIAQNRAIRENFTQVQAALRALVPETLPPAQRELVARDMARDLKSYVDSRNMLTLPVQDIPTILAARLGALGLSVEDASQRIAEVGQSRTRQAFTRPAAPRAPAPGTPAGRGTPPAPAATPSGKTFVAAQAKRREVAAIPPSGAGSPGAPGGAFLPINPDGTRMTTEQALAAHRARFAKGIKSY